MHVTCRTPETLVIEDAPDIRLGWAVAAAGAIVLFIPWSEGPGWLAALVAAVFVFAGLKIALFSRTTTHRFERDRALITMRSKGRWQPERRRELPFDSIADVILAQKQVRGGEAGLRYWVEYATTQGERIAWSGFTSSKADKVECVEAARAFLGLAHAKPREARSEP